MDLFAWSSWLACPGCSCAISAGCRSKAPGWVEEQGPRCSGEIPGHLAAHLPAPCLPDWLLLLRKGPRLCAGQRSLPCGMAPAACRGESPSCHALPALYCSITCAADSSSCARTGSAWHCLGPRPANTSGSATTITRGGLPQPHQLGRECSPPHVPAALLRCRGGRLTCHLCGMWQTPLALTIPAAA